jgi:hypothetical protein
MSAVLGLLCARLSLARLASQPLLLAIMLISHLLGFCCAAEGRGGEHSVRPIVMTAAALAEVSDLVVAVVLAA